MFFTYKYTIFVKTALLQVFCNFLVMKIGRKVADLRKDKGMSREELGKQVGTSTSVIGRYERDEMTPSIDAAKKIAKILNTTVGYLLGETKETNLLSDPDMLKRLNDIASLPDTDKNHILYTIDNLLASVKTRLAYS